MASGQVEGFIDPNLHKYTATSGGKYLSTRLLNHAGTTIAIALGKKRDGGSLFFDYSILNAETEEVTTNTTKTDSSKPVEKLDSQSWFENAKSLLFPQELRVVGEEANPAYEIPPVDKRGRKVSSSQRDQLDKLDLWLSTTLCLMKPDVIHFDVFSDGKYVYLFRQSRLESDELTKRVVEHVGPGVSPMDGNLLCDRFTLVGATLQRTLEVRYRRSRQKRLPLNEQDTLAVRDINDVFFYEPTFSLRFMGDLIDGSFSVLQTPTVTNGGARWTFFAMPRSTRQIEYITTNVARDGLFDVRGQIYYTCDSPDHDKIFSNVPGACSATSKETGATCGNSKKPIVPKVAFAGTALSLNDPVEITSISLPKAVALNTEKFIKGYTLEAWLRPIPQASWSSSGGALLPPAGTSFTVFLMDGDSSTWPNLYLNDKLQLVLQCGKARPVLATSITSVKANEWNHISMIYTGGGQTGNYQLTINGQSALSAPYVIANASGGPSSFSGMFSPGGFHGQVDEVRLWSIPLHPSTIKAARFARAIGTEPYLEACWHFDEGSGDKAFDATAEGQHMSIVLKNTTPSLDKMWMSSTVPILAGYGLMRRSVRLESNLEPQGGLDASVYYEQVSQALSDNDASSGAEESGAKSQKRAARLLLCFGVKISSDQNIYVAAVDFGILADGTLSDWPGTLALPKITLSPMPGSVRECASTALIYLDAQGVEVFGGILAFDKARCSSDPPFVWDSATGTLTIYFRSYDGTFSAMTYDNSRQLDVTASTPLSSHTTLLANSRLRQAQEISITTLRCNWVVDTVAVNLSLKATLANGSNITETWNGIPAGVESFCDLLNGINVPVRKDLGSFKSLTKSAGSDPVTYSLVLETPLIDALSMSSCIKLDEQSYQLIKNAKAKDTTLVISQPYNQVTSGFTAPDPAANVIYLGYDHESLVTCSGKPAGDFTQGSSIITALPASTGIGESYDSEDGVVNPGGTSMIKSPGQSPFFSSPPLSSAIKTQLDDKVYTMLEVADTTVHSAGIAVESWIKVDDVNESIIVSYISERLPRSEDSESEFQTFILAIPASSNGKASYELIGNVNGQLFSIVSSVLQASQWVHFACSLTNVLALRFSGVNYVDLGSAQEWNVGDFTLVFTLQVTTLGREQVLFTKSETSGQQTPLHITLTAQGTLKLSYWAENEDGSDYKLRSVESLNQKLVAGQAYKIFISRALYSVPKKDSVPRMVQAVTMRAWTSDDQKAINLVPASLATIEAGENSSQTNPHVTASGPAQYVGSTKSNEAPLFVAGASWATNQGLIGYMGPIRLYSSAITLPESSAPFLGLDSGEKSLIGSWSFRTSDVALLNDLGMNHGKLKNEPVWTICPFKPDLQLSIFLNGVRTQISTSKGSPLLATPAGPHQLTLGNVVYEYVSKQNIATRYLALLTHFVGEYDEFRIWNTPRTRENITDTMTARLTEIPVELAVYLPFDDANAGSTSSDPAVDDFAILFDASLNGWHTTSLYGFPPVKTVSTAPVGADAVSVQHVLSGASDNSSFIAAKVVGATSVNEYGDLQVGISGSLEGVYKRAYAFIDTEGKWCLNTGFRVGTLLTEWVSQVQTSPTLIGYIEGAPPFPAEDYRDYGPYCAIEFSMAESCTYSYGLQTEEGEDKDINFKTAMGAQWQVSAGLGVETQVTKGSVMAGGKGKIAMSSAHVENNISMLTTNTDMSVRMGVSGSVVKPDENSPSRFVAANTGLALVESEVADVYALRLKLRGPVSPLVAYQMRPNPDIPKDRNLISFLINKSYTKQGCLDGRFGLENDPDFPPLTQAPKDASYLKPIQAYALKDSIRRAEEQLQGEYERYQMNAIDGSSLPSRTHRNICNSYVWTADGGTFQETHSTMDFVSSEVSNSKRDSSGFGLTLEVDISAGPLATSNGVDAMSATYTQVMQTKSVRSGTGFQLTAELPQAVEIRELKDVGGGVKELVKRVGAVDTYRWMSFWLEPSVEGTDAFFAQVVDPKWLVESRDGNARTLRELSAALASESGNARTKAWRLLHRVTYVSRVLDEVSSDPAQEAAAATPAQKKQGALMAEIASDWILLQNLEPIARGAKTKAEISNSIQDKVRTLYPAIKTQPIFYGQLVDFLAEYLGVE